MRTENELRDAIDALADQAPEPADTRIMIASDRRRVWPRRLVVIAVVAGCLAAIAVPSLHRVVRRAADTEPAVPSPGPPRWQQPLFTAVPAPGWRVELTENSPGRSDVGIGSATAQAGCWLSAFAPGRFDVRAIPARRTATTVGGKPAIFGPFELQFGDGIVADGEQSLAWQYAPDAWAVVYCRDDDADRRTPDGQRRLAREAAAMMRFGPGRLRTPIAIDPAAGDPRTERIGTYRAVRHLDERRNPPSVRATTLLGLGDQIVSVDLRQQSPVDPESEPGATRVDVDGRPGWTVLVTMGPDRYERRGLIVDTGNGTMLEIVSYAGPADASDELVAMARRIRIAADLEDQSTWYDAADSLP